MKIPFLLALILCGLAVHSQNFEGKIYYSNSYQSKSKSLNDRSLAQMYGDREEYIYRNGNYLAITNGSLIEWTMYRKEENRLYQKIGNSDTLYFSDAATNQDSVIKAEIRKNVMTILNYTCDELILTTKTGVHHYFFSSRFMIDPKAFLKHRVGNWNEVVKRAKAIPLKMIVETPQFTLISEAMSFKYIELDPAMFRLDPGIPVAKGG